MNTAPPLPTSYPPTSCPPPYVPVRPAWPLLYSLALRPLGLLCLLLLVSGIPVSGIHAAPLRVQYRIEARLEPDLRHLTGTFTAQIQSETPLRELLVLAYPRHLNQAEKSDELTFNQLYPAGFDSGDLELELRLDELALPLEPLPIPFDLHPDAPSGALLRLLLPPTVVGQHALTLSGRFSLTIPVRYGGFGQAEGQITLAGGWFPMLLRPPDSAGLPLELPETELELHLSHPGTLQARLDMRLPQELDSSPSSSEPAETPGMRSSSFFSQHSSPLLTVGQAQAHLFGEGPPVLLLDWRDLPAERASLARVLERMRFCWQAAGLAPLEVLPPLHRVPLRRALAEVLDDGVLLSDRALRAFPLIQRLHEYAVVHAIFQSWLMQARRQDEHAHDLRWVSDGLAWYLVELYRRSLFLGGLRAMDVMRTLSFVPQFDQMLYAPRFAFASELYDAPYRLDPLREALPELLAPNPGGRVMFMKLEDRFRPEAVTAAAGEVLRGRSGSFLAHLASHSGETHETLEAWTRHWMRPYPLVDYKLLEVTYQRASQGWRTMLSVQEVPIRDPAPEEPVLIRVTTRRDTQELSWEANEAGQPAQLEVLTRDRVRRVELDPERRLLELSPSGMLLRDNNVWPPPRKLLFAFSPGTIDLSSLRYSGGVGLYLTRPHDRSWLALLEVATSTQVLASSRLAAFRYFGPHRDAQWRVHSVGVSLQAEHRGNLELLDEPTESWLQSMGLRVSYRYDSRLLLQEGTRGAMFYAGVEPGIARGPDFSQPFVEGTLSATRPVEFYPHHLLVGRAQADGAIGLPEGEGGLGEGLFSLGGPSTVRALSGAEQVGNLRWISSLEYRWTALPHLDIDLWLTRIRSVQTVLFCDVGAVGYVPADLLEPRWDGGVGLRVFSDLFGLRQSIAGIDVAWLLSDAGAAGVGTPRILLRAGQTF